MTRTPLFLAALASSAVPGLDPVVVEGVATDSGSLFDVALVRDRQEREWVVTAPRTPAAGALLDDAVPLTALLSKRLDVSVPAYRGHAAVPEGRAAVYPRMPGRPIDFAELPAGPLAVEVGRVLAHVHNIEHLIYEEAGRPSYTADEHRRRRLSDLDRAASTGHVPTGLLTRWERLLEDVSLWRFAPTAVHGRFTGADLLVSFDDEDDASTGRVVGLLGWEDSRIADPADDFADLVAQAAPSTLDAVLEAYAESRVERPDANLVRRARLAAETAFLTALLQASAAGDEHRVRRTATVMRDLDGRIEEVDGEYAREDAARSERTRRAQALAAAAELDPDDPEHPIAPGDRAVPAEPFPMLAETQAVPMSLLLADDPGQGRPADAAPGPATAGEARGDQSSVADGAAGGDAQAPDEAPDEGRDEGPDGARGEAASGRLVEASDDLSASRRAATVLIDTSIDGPVPVHASDHTDDADGSPAEASATSGGHAPADRPLTGAVAPGAEQGTPEQPDPEVRTGPVPYVDAADASPFEIDEVEALPDDGEGVMDLHEGASEFVPVARRVDRPPA